MNIRILLLLVILGNQLNAQQNQFKPTNTDIDSIYDRVERELTERFLKSNPIQIDISEESRDSIFLILINNYRQSKGLNTLTFAPVLDSACELHTNWMLKEQIVGHDETSVNTDGLFYPKFTDRIRRFDPNWMVNHHIIFENCGGGNSAIGNDPFIKFKRITKDHVYEIFNAWKASPGHNAAMLDANVKYIGFYLGSRYNAKQNSHVVLGTLLVSN
jgi:uncharacterized protein YkwD